MIRLNARNHEVFRYVPPIQVEHFFGDIDVTADANHQVECLLWIPATLVARFRHQFPRLHCESDELFSIGVAKVVEVVNRFEFPGNKIGAVCNVQCRRAMEDYANGLNSVVKVCTTTQYENRKRGVTTPSCSTFNHHTASGLAWEDDPTELIVRDAAASIGVDIDALTRTQKRKLAEVLKA